MRHSRSSLFLMEMIISILFFSLASAVCLQLFSKSHKLSSRTVNQNHAVIQAQNLAECFLAYEGDLSSMTALLEQGSLDATENTLSLSFDSQWNLTREENAVFQASLTSLPVNDAGLITGDIVISEIGKPSATDLSDKTDDSSQTILYSLQVTHHIAERRGNHE